MYLTPYLDPSDILHIWIGYSFEYAPPSFEVLL